MIASSREQYIKVDGQTHLIFNVHSRTTVIENLMLYVHVMIYKVFNETQLILFLTKCTVFIRL